uniref:Uncharacterized protein n=1 Tax=Rhizophora mucronata TaxID=61149 RepID=A0A2P2P4U7_RHIMU
MYTLKSYQLLIVLDYPWDYLSMWLFLRIFKPFLSFIDCQKFEIALSI